MKLFKTIFCLAIFLLFVTLLAVTDDSNAAGGGRVSSIQPPSETGYRTPYLNEAKPPLMAPWLYETWTAERYSIPEHENGEEAERILARFERTGLIVGLDETHKWQGLPVIEVGDLFLRLADSDKNRVLVTFNNIVSRTDDYKAASYAIEHRPTGQYLGLFTPQGLQLQ